MNSSVCSKETGSDQSTSQIMRCDKNFPYKQKLIAKEREIKNKNKNMFASMIALLTSVFLLCVALIDPSMALLVAN
jgi:hypothetical protein